MGVFPPEQVYRRKSKKNAPVFRRRPWQIPAITVDQEGLQPAGAYSAVTLVAHDQPFAASRVSVTVAPEMAAGGLLTVQRMPDVVPVTAVTVQFCEAAAFGAKTVTSGAAVPELTASSYATFKAEISAVAAVIFARA